MVTVPVKSIRVKICGITRVSDACVAAEVGADAIGIVFYPPSSRYVSDLATARDIALAVGPFVTVVGLFVDATAEDVSRVQKAVPLNLLQFHGNEDEAYCRQFAQPYIKALRMKAGIDVPKAIAAYSSASGILLDTYVEGAPGGTGQVFNWSQVPRDTQSSIVVAGGLTPDNVSEAIEHSRPYGVDVSGGVESKPGVKSGELMKAFVEAAKGTNKNESVSE